MMFRQVVLQQLWNFELFVFKPGTKRDMEDFENPREVRHLMFFSFAYFFSMLKFALLFCVILY